MLSGKLRREGQMKWEYYCFSHGIGHGLEKLENALNQEGEKGWELMSVNYNEYYIHVYYKRPKKISN
jgi:hypothetical protein